ncbi:hypothetical protein EXS74_01400 [Candidatus Woesearchaeota archaeon]|nr:hypothetical protein [Candidatus Woesearchaeota archaeon]
MEWQTWTKISAVVLFILAIAGFYLSNFHSEGVILSIEDFPQKLDSLDANKDISFTFYIYNTGDKTAFIQSVYVTTVSGESVQIIERSIEVTPQNDFKIEEDSSQEITVLLPSPGAAANFTLTAQVFYDDDKSLTSEQIPVAWGTLL